MRVSIIIPCFNQGRFLAAAVESALRQPGADVEVIVVDDGSTDSTAEVAAGYPGVRYVHQNNRGLANARNRGFEESTGSHVLFLDADDFLGPRALASALASLSEEPRAAMTFGAMQVIAPDGLPLWVRPPRKSRYHYQDLLTANYIPTPGLALLVRTALEEHGLFDPALAAAEDYDLWLRIARHELITSHHEIAVHRRLHPQAMTREPGRMLRSSVEVHERHREPAMRDPALRSKFLEGAQTWRRFYGEQTLTAARLHSYAGHAARANENIALMQEYCPELVPRLVVEPFKSNTVTFEYRSEDANPLHVDASTLERADRSTAGNRRCIRALSQPAAGPGRAAASQDELVVQLTCVNHGRCSVTFVDDEPVDTIWTSADTLLAYMPVARLAAKPRHDVFFIA